MGIRLLLQSGIQVVLMTSETTTFSQARGNKLGIKRVITGASDKAEALCTLCTELGIPLEETAFIGDDVNDLPALKLCGIAACPSDAVASVRSASDYICEAKGGLGAMREFAELILVSQKTLTILSPREEKGE
jgi:YrbI family 3-deoxy-D-manno-octulosonate 8-phosphate phosphatase